VTNHGGIIGLSGLPGRLWHLRCTIQEPMIRTLSILAVLTAFSTSACQKERESKTPGDTPKQLPDRVADVAIASVTILEDCPDSDAKPSADRQSAPSGDMADNEADMGGYAHGGMPCSQSSMQISITGLGDASSQLAIKATRLLGPKGDTVGTLVTRRPKIWKAEGYAAWDETIMPKTDVKASYKLSLPNWSEVQNKIDGSTYNTMFRLEADIEIDGVPKTIRSSEVVREQTEMVDT
jgi:hypothetical protein